MKKLFYLLFALSIMACSSSDSSMPEEENNQSESQENILLLTKVIEEDNLYTNEVIHEYSYENGLLTKTTVSIANDAYESFEYDNEGNISKVSHYAPNYSTNEIQLFEEIAIAQKDNQILRHSVNGDVTIIYTLNSDNQIIKRECETCETILFEYNKDGKISTQTVYSILGTGDVNSATFEYDDGINPFHTLFNEFRFMENYKTNFLDNSMEFYLSNLVSKEYNEDGEVKFSATYEKNELGYPTKAYWEAPLVGEVGEVTFEYQPIK